MSGGEEPPEQPQENLLLAMAAAQPGDTITLESGIYTLDDSDIQLGPAGAEQQHTVIQAAPGTRVILTSQNGGVPRLNVANYVDLVGLWIGGQRDINAWALPMGHHCRMEKCTFFGYKQAIIEGDGYANVYRDNRFVRCGKNNLHHALYISGDDVGLDKSALVSGNIFVTCDGYALHLWHKPVNCQVKNNFIGGGTSMIAVDGSDHKISGNIFWSGTGYFYLSNATNTDFTRNIIGVTCPLPDSTWLWGNEGNTSGNYWMLEPRDWDTSPVKLLDADVLPILGVSSTDINTAVKAIEAKFSDMATLFVDGATEYYFDVLKSALDAWNQTA